MPAQLRRRRLPLVPIAEKEYGCSGGGRPEAQAAAGREIQCLGRTRHIGNDGSHGTARDGLFESPEKLGQGLDPADHHSVGRKTEMGDAGAIGEPDVLPFIGKAEDNERWTWRGEKGSDLAKRKTKGSPGIATFVRVDFLDDPRGDGKEICRLIGKKGGGAAQRRPVLESFDSCF